MADSILEQIATNVLDVLGKITTDNGFENTVTASRHKQHGNEIADKLVVLFQEDPAKSDAAPQGHIWWVQPFAAACFVLESETSTTAVDSRINSLRSDVERALCLDRNRIGLAVDTVIDAPNLIVDDVGGVSGIVVRFSVHYRTLEDDPYSQ